jgi:hypothetical protein
MAATPLRFITRPHLVTSRMRPVSGPSVRHFASFFGRRPLTALRRQGVGTPTRLPHPGSSDLSADALVQQSVELAFETLGRLDRQAIEVASRFRANALEDARAGLRDLMHATQGLLALATAALAAAGVDLDDLPGSWAVNPRARTSAVMSELIWHQQRENPHALAAVLERPFAEAVASWRHLFATLASSTDPSGHAA